MWDKVSKIQIGMKNSSLLSYEATSSRRQSSRRVLTVQQSEFVARLARVEREIVKRVYEPCRQDLRLTRDLCLRLDTGRVRGGGNIGTEVVRHDSIVLACPKAAGWRRCFLSLVARSKDNAMPMSSINAIYSQSTLVICKDAADKTRFLYEMFKVPSLRVKTTVLTNRLPVKSQLESDLIVVTQKDYTALEAEGLTRKRQILTMWCCDPSSSKWTKLPDAASAMQVSRVEAQELDDVSFEACKRTLHGFPAEEFPLSFVTFRRVLHPGKINRGILALCHMTRVVCSSKPIPASQFVDVLPANIPRAVSSAVLTDGWMTRDSVVVLRKSMRSTPTVSNVTKEPTQLLVNCMAKEFCESDLQAAELGCLSEDRRKTAMDYTFGIEELRSMTSLPREGSSIRRRLLGVAGGLGSQSSAICARRRTATRCCLVGIYLQRVRKRVCQQKDSCWICQSV